MTASPAAPSAPVSWWRFPHLLGLDAVAVALLWMTVFGGVKGARLDRVEYWVLGAAVWVIYMGDRLFDNLRPPVDGAGLRDRHFFAARFAKWLAALVPAVAGAAVLAALFHMRGSVVRHGVVLISLTGCYYAMTWIAREKTPGRILLWVVSLGLAMLLLSWSGDAPFPSTLWRTLLFVGLVMTLFVGRKTPGTPAPWILPRKIIGGYLFALGSALAPYAHLDDREGLLFSAPVVLFGACCAMNSLGIRLWEKRTSSLGDGEENFLTGLYPLLCAALCVGALSEAREAGAYSRTALVAVAAVFPAFAALHFLRRRIPVAVIPVLADAVVALAGAGAILWQRMGR